MLSAFLGGPPLLTTRGPPRKADNILDTTCFSTSDIFDDFVSQDHSLSSISNPTDMQNHEYADVMEILRKKAISNGVLDVHARYVHPTFPSAAFLTTLIQQERFKEYISNEFSYLNHQHPRVSTTNHEPLRKEVNATVANSLLNTVLPNVNGIQVGTSEWVGKAIFPDDFLPVPFNDGCLDNVPECWDRSTQRFSNFPETMGEHVVQDWLNHLAHTLGVRHGLIKEEEPKEEPKEFLNA